MGIKGLSKVIADHAPNAIKESEIKHYFGRKVAVDASMSIYQFLIAVRSEGSVLTNEAGETTSHIMGMFYRTIRMMDNGIKPVYVFDGAPPKLKSGELAKRGERRKEAEASLATALESGAQEDADKFSRRLVKVTKEHNEDCKTLLRLMGVPYVQAPCEAEAQCAALARAGRVFATGTEDMDALTLDSPVLLRHLTFSEARKLPIQEFHLDKVLAEFEMTHEQFVDLCILLGCDYCDSIRGVGPKKAFDLIKSHKTIEEVLKHLDTKKYPPPEDWPFVEARRLFLEADVTPASEVEMKWTDPDEEKMVEFMCGKHNFDETRIRNALKKLTSARNKPTQSRVDSFFTIKPAQKSSPGPPAKMAKVESKSTKASPATGASSKATSKPAKKKSGLLKTKF